MARLLLWALAQMFGPEMVYPHKAGESVTAAITHYGTEEREVHDSTQRD